MYSKLIELIESKNYIGVKKEIREMNEADVAEVLENIQDNTTVIKILRLMPKDMSAEVFSYFHTSTKKNIVETFSENELTKLIEESYFDDVIDLIEEMPANIASKIIRSVSKEKRQLINQFLNYPNDSAGSIMTIEYIDLKESTKILDAIEHIKQLDLDDENINICYVTDAKRVLKGIIPLRKLLFTEDNFEVGSIMQEETVAFNTNDETGYCAEMFKKYDIATAPVVDNEKRLVGIITIDDIIDVIEQENTEDFQRIAGTIPSDETYLESSVLKLSRNRIVWLLILMISATLAGMVIRHYENVLETMVVLVSFIPMLMGTGGNSGSQASTLIIRGMALEEIKTKDFTKIIFKELRIGILVALLLSVLNFLRIYFFENVGLKVSLVVCSTLFITVIIAKLVGGALPIVAKKLKQDPALMAAPLITTILDVAVLVIYMSIAKIILGL